MPTYSFTCQGCSKPFERVLAMSERAQAQTCPECGGAAKQGLSTVDFVLQGDGWPGKAMKIGAQMGRKNKRLGIKQKERPKALTLAPNVGGERVDSWAEAKRLAADKGKDTSTYDPLVRQEQGGKK